MLNLLQNNQNNVNVTVSNESELTNPTYLWVLTHLETREKTYFIPTNISSPHALRFDTFTFNANNYIPEVFTGLTCNIHLAQGQYQYTIYDQVSQTNLNPAMSNSVVESGLAWVQQNEVCYETYITDNDDAEAVVYYNPGTCFIPWNEVNVNWEEAAWNWEDTPILN